MVFSHAFVGAAVAHVVAGKKKFTKRQKISLWVVAIVASIFPDFDLSLILLNPTLLHRELISHSILPYIVIFGLGWLIADALGSRFIKTLNLVFFLGILSHLVLDLLIGGVVLLAPLTWKTYGYDIYSCTGDKFWIIDYLKSWYLLVEIVPIALYFWFVRHWNIGVYKMFPWVIFAVAVILSVVFANL